MSNYQPKTYQTRNLENVVVDRRSAIDDVLQIDLLRLLDSRLALDFGARLSLHNLCGFGWHVAVSSRRIAVKRRRNSKETNRKRKFV